MKESLIDKLDRLEKEVSELRSELSSVNKSKAPAADVDYESLIAKVVNQEFVTKLYRNT